MHFKQQAGVTYFYTLHRITNQVNTTFFLTLCNGYALKETYKDDMTLLNV